MSRSYKQPWVKDGGHKGKQIHARKMRRITHQILTEFTKILFPEEGPQFPVDDEVTNGYDICDYRFYGEKPHYKRK